MNNISATTVLRDTFGQRHLLSAVMAVMIMLISMPAQSEPEEGKGNQQDAKMQAFQEAREHLREVQQQLDEIQQKTMEAYPELKEKENNFRDLLFSIMRDKGYTPEEDMK
jgi:peptidoglycan hydrolase CwlO-like protein